MKNTENTTTQTNLEVMRKTQTTKRRDTLLAGRALLAGFITRNKPQKVSRE